MKIKVSDVKLSESLRNKMRYVTDYAYAHQCIEAPIEKFYKAYEETAKVAKRAEQRIAKKYPGVPEPGVSGPSPAPDTAKKTVSDAIMSRARIEKESVSHPSEKSVVFEFFNRYAINYATKLGGKSELADVGVFRIWDEGIPYWSPSANYVYVFLPKEGYGKYGKGFMIKVDKKIAQKSSLFLDVVQKWGPLPLSETFKTVWQSRYPVYKNAIVREFKKRWRAG